MEDARFEDGREAPLNLGALDTDDLKIISALAQDAVLPVSEMKWDAVQRRFALLVNRFRWEDQDAASARGRAVERVQAVLMFNSVLSVSSSGIDRGDKDTVLSLLSVAFEETDAPSGHVVLTLAGDGAIRLKVEALDALLKDVTRPYVAPSKQTPAHDL